jgi:hypothetical protein
MCDVLSLESWLCDKKVTHLIFWSFFGHAGLSTENQDPNAVLIDRVYVTGTDKICPVNRNYRPSALPISTFLRKRHGSII